MEADNFTQMLAIWGAITGTIGTVAGIANLALRVKQHKKDQPTLVCTSDIAFEHFSGYAKPKHKLILRSVGKRPVTIDFIKYCVNPKGFWQKLLRNRNWNSNKWVYIDKPNNTLQITEGMKEEIKISLPNGLELSQIIKVYIHDQSGKVWNVKWLSTSKLSVLSHYEFLYETEEENESRSCKLNGYTASGLYYIYALWNPKPKNKSTKSGKTFRFDTKCEYDRKLIDLIENQQPKLLSCESDDLV